MRGVSARCQRKTPNHRCQALPKPQSSQDLWGSTLGAVHAECSSKKGSRGVHASHEGLLPSLQVSDQMMVRKFSPEDPT